jgi:hypothetical protein
MPAVSPSTDSWRASRPATWYPTVHEESGLLGCACGLTASTPDELAEHLLKAWTPANAIGRDGRTREPT